MATHTFSYGFQLDDSLTVETSRERSVSDYDELQRAASNANDGTKIVLEDGNYDVRGSLSAQGDRTLVFAAASGANPTLVVPEGFRDRLLNFDLESFVFEGIDIDCRSDNASVKNWLSADEAFVVADLELFGDNSRTDGKRPHRPFLKPDLRNHDSVGILSNIVAPTVDTLTRYGEGDSGLWTIWTGPEGKGTIEVLNSYLGTTSSHGCYAAASNGPVNFRNTYVANTNGYCVRVPSDSHIEGCLLEHDYTRLPSGQDKDDATTGGMTLFMETKKRHSNRAPETGGLVYDSMIRAANWTTSLRAGFLIAASHGAVDIVDSVIDGSDAAMGIHACPPTGGPWISHDGTDTHPSYSLPPEPYRIALKNSKVRGSKSVIWGRDVINENSSIQDLDRRDEKDAPKGDLVRDMNSYRGEWLTAATAGAISAADGSPAVAEGDSPDEVTDGEPASDAPDSGGGDSGDTGGPTAGKIKVDLRPAGRLVQYEFVTREDVMPGPEANVDIGDDSLDEDTNTVRGYGKGYYDTYLVSPDFAPEDLIDFRAWYGNRDDAGRDVWRDREGAIEDIEVSINGEAVPTEQLIPRPHSLVLNGEDTEGPAGYDVTFAPGASVAKSDQYGATIDSSDEISTADEGVVAIGTVNGGVDAYRYGVPAGASHEDVIRSFDTSGEDENLAVYLDEDRIDPADFADGGEKPAAGNTVNIEGGDKRIGYRFTVSGRITPNNDSSYNADDITEDGRTAYGIVAGGVDPYRFSGDITDFQLIVPKDAKDAGADVLDYLDYDGSGDLDLPVVFRVNGEDKTNEYLDIPELDFETVAGFKARFARYLESQIEEGKIKL